ncbi:MAG TPA: hypothetical protein VLF93_06540 [Candidatus Saccharimonadales bacterium]|nr:hypothetical protein [Candidatus Saccharimonadales bacterium]
MALAERIIPLKDLGISLPQKPQEGGQQDPIQLRPLKGTNLPINMGEDTSVRVAATDTNCTAVCSIGCPNSPEASPIGKMQGREGAAVDIAILQKVPKLRIQGKAK